MQSTSTSELQLKRKCKNYYPAEKLNILKELDENVPINELAKKYNVNVRTIKNWKQDRLKLEEMCQDTKSKRKRQRKSLFDVIDKALFIWFEEMRIRSIPLNGPLLKAKALELAKEMSTSENFVASEGWLNRWKVRHEIRSLTICGEKRSADVNAAEKFKENLDLENIEEDLTLAQIFNADETGLNYKMLPTKTLVAANERQAFGFKQSKERVTVMVCSNADGSFKLPLVVIGKSAKPRKLKNISKNLLPVYYTNQKNAWMNSDIFEKWFKEEFVPRVSAFLKEKKLVPLKAILYLDNAPCHPSAESLSVNSNIKVYYLPPNTTSLIQPMDQGIIENLKRRYRSQLLRNVLNAQKEEIGIITFLKSISLKDVIYWISDAWIAVEPAMIKKCWKKLLYKKFSAKFFEHENEDNVTAESNTIDLLNDIRQLNDYENITEDVVECWIMNDDNCFTSMPSNNDIIQMAIKDSESEESEHEEENVTPREAIVAADKLISFYEKNAFLTMDEFAILRKCKNVAIMLNIK